MKKLHFLLTFKHELARFTFRHILYAAFQLIEPITSAILSIACSFSYTVALSSVTFSFFMTIFIFRAWRRRRLKLKFDHISTHLEDRQKYPASRLIFSVFTRKTLLDQIS